MAENISDNQKKRSFGFLPQQNAWLVNWIDEPGLVRLMHSSEVGASAVSGRQKDGQAAKYWKVARDKFEFVRQILIELNYQEFVPQNSSQNQSAAESSPNTASALRIASHKEAAAVSPGISSDNPYSVKAISAAIASTVKIKFPFDIWVKGEVTGFNRNRNGHVYFDLREPSQSQNERVPVIRCCIWRSNWDNMAAAIRDELNDGNGKVILVCGKLSYYEAGSSVSLSVSAIDERFAEGAFYRQKEAVENALREKGIHDNNKKIAMPILPFRIAVFSNKSAAGYDDFTKILSRSKLPFRIDLFEVVLQGEKLEASFLNAFKCLSQIGYDRYDAAAIVRGGGGAVDIMLGYNSGKIAEFVAQCPLKFLIGVGHEKDRCVLDEIALRYETPSAMADDLVIAVNAQKIRLEKNCYDLTVCARTMISDNRNALNLKSSQFSNLVKDRIHDAGEILSHYVLALSRCANKQSAKDKDNLMRQMMHLQKIAAEALENRRSILRDKVHAIELQAGRVCNEQENCLDRSADRIKSTINMKMMTEWVKLKGQNERMHATCVSRLEQKQTALDNAQEKLELLDPSKLFARGFVIVTDKHGQKISHTAQLHSGDEVSIKLADGCAEAVIAQISSNASESDN